MDYLKYQENIKKCRFALYKTIYIENHIQREFKTIILKDIETGYIIIFTNYADYLLYEKSDIDVYSTNDQMLFDVCELLNFIFIDNYEKYGITSIYDLEVSMFQDYLSDCCTNRKLKKRTLETKRRSISIFGEMLCNANKKQMKHLKRKSFINTYYSVNQGKRERRVEYYLKIHTYGHGSKNDSGLSSLLRDMPISIADRIIQMAEIYDPELCFPIVLQLYGGLRTGEICNVRRKESPYGPGVILELIKLTDKNGGKYLKCISFQIDLRQEYMLRSDGANVGKIKKERYSSIYGPLVDIVYKYYNKHLELIKDKPCENTKPMFLLKNRDKKTNTYLAMTKKSYVKRVLNLMNNYVVPSLKDDADSDLALFYHHYQFHTWGPHAFRHWFTVFLLFNGVDDVVTLMDLRGDKSPLSAQDYLKRKGILMETYKKSMDKFARRLVD